jgi:cytochrome P450
MPVDRPIIDFDHHTVEYQERAREMYRDLRDTCPVGWTEQHGGYWVFSGYEDVWQALRDHETFSSAKWQEPDGTWRGGDVIPDTPSPPLYPLDLDPPVWNDYRRVLNPWLAPAAVEARKDRLQAYATELFDRVIEQGQCDLILDFGNPMPAMSTLDLVGLELDDWHRWAEPHHAIQYAAPGSPAFMEAVEGMMWQRAQLAAAIVDRRARPRDDLVTAVAQADVMGEPMTPEDGAALILTVIGGGVDTTTALFANSLLYLHRNHDQRARLLEDVEQRLPVAVEEFLRVFPPVPAVARTVLKDASSGGARQCPRERVAISVLSANHDPQEFDEPEEIRLDRFPNRHVTFGIGIHRCVGSYAARTMVRLMLETVLQRIPDYRIDEDQMVRYGPSSAVDGWISVPVTFTPGPRIGSGITLP